MELALARYQNSPKSWPDTRETRGSLSCNWRTLEIQANYCRDHKFWLLSETHLLIRICVCQVEGSMCHLPGRQRIYIQLQEGSSVCVCACAGACKQVREPATGVGLQSQGCMTRCQQLGRVGSRASYWRAPHCIYVCIPH